MSTSKMKGDKIALNLGAFCSKDSLFVGFKLRFHLIGMHLAKTCHFEMLVFASD